MCECETTTSKLEHIVSSSYNEASSQWARVVKKIYEVEGGSKGERICGRATGIARRI